MKIVLLGSGNTLGLGIMIGGIDKPTPSSISLATYAEAPTAKSLAFPAIACASEVFASAIRL